MTIQLVKAAHSDDTHSDKERCVANLRLLLADCFQLRRKGAPHSRMSYAQGYADGYMKTMLDAGLVTQTELLEIVVACRRGVDGPATAALSELSDLSPDVGAVSA